MVNLARGNRILWEHLVLANKTTLGKWVSHLVSLGSSYRGKTFPEISVDRHRCDSTGCTSFVYKVIHRVQ
jgi:hypothetical protein